MCPLVGTILRRGRRLGLTSPLSLLRRFFSMPSPPTKHIKIDDEEQQSTDPTFTHSRAPLIHMLKMILLTLLVLIFIMAIFAYIIYKPSKLIIDFVQWKYPDVLFQVRLPTLSRVVALTLDDAPSDETSKMLDLLKLHSAKATFFIIGGQIAAHPDLLQRMHDEGHEVGNHAWADEPSVKLPLSELERQIKEVDALLPINAGSAKYFRPGSGIFSKRMVERVKSLGYRVVLGGIYPHDPQIHSAKMNAAHVLSMVRPGGIIIMHDRRSYSSEQLELVLSGLTAGEWKVESVGGLLRIAEEGEGKKSG